MDLLNTIELHKNNFSKTEYQVYEYIMKYPETIETSTISKIADVSQTSTSAVLRFCQVLGFKGYKDFRFEMIKYLHEHHEEKNTSDLFTQLTQEYIKTIGQFKNIDRQIIDQLINDIKSTHSIYIIGIHYSSLPAKEFVLGLQDLGITALTASDFIEASHLINNANEDSTIIFFSMNGSKTNFNRFLPSLIDNMPERSYLVTMNPNAKLIDIFTHTIVIPGYTFTKQSIIETQSIFNTFVEILLNLIHNKLA